MRTVEEQGESYEAFGVFVRSAAQSQTHFCVQNQ